MIDAGEVSGQTSGASGPPFAEYPISNRRGPVQQTPFSATRKLLPSYLMPAWLLSLCPGRYKLPAANIFDWEWAVSCDDGFFSNSIKALAQHRIFPPAIFSVAL